MSLGHFTELRMKKQYLLDKANQKKETIPETEELDVDIFGNIVNDNNQRKLTSIEAYSTGILAVENLILNNKKIEQFGSITTGLNSDTFMLSSTQQQQHDVIGCYDQNKENGSSFMSKQKTADQYVKKRILKDHLKELFH